MRSNLQRLFVSVGILSGAYRLARKICRNFYVDKTGIEDVTAGSSKATERLMLEDFFLIRRLLRSLGRN